MLGKGQHARHAVALGYVLGGNVGIPDDGIHRLRAKGIKGVIAAGAGSLGSIAVMLRGLFKQVAYFQHAVAGDILPGQPALADHLAGFLTDNRP